MIERVGKLADFRGAAQLHAFVEFGAADGAHRLHQAANRPRDADGKGIQESSATNMERLPRS